ncbi:hypothetical protein ASE66_24595 [Bosea sp. Root483D1]|nr:hypothetical protein ASE66_24595 [Bosea sp. Root483D1]
MPLIHFGQSGLQFDQSQLREEEVDVGSALDGELDNHPLGRIFTNDDMITSSPVTGVLGFPAMSGLTY